MTPGVYLMKDVKGRILYVGKAGNLKRRVSSYFLRPHDYRIQKLASQIKKIDYEKTDTSIEALILESQLIKKYQPPYNVREKDDTSFLYVEITREQFPRVLLVRGKSKAGGIRFGPFTSASNIRAALRILRKIFPYSTHGEGTRKQGLGARRPCFDYQIGLCPGTCVGAIGRKDYFKNIRNLKLLFEGRKVKILKNLKSEMTAASKNLEFEKAEKFKRQLFALQHIRDIALITEEGLGTKERELGIRIEGYDVSNISGTSAVGSMVVFRDDKPDKNEYRRFRIQSLREPNDVGMLKEMLRRRFRHTAGDSWPLPHLILIDGGKGQVNAAKMVLLGKGLKIPVIGIAKGPTRKKNEFIGALPKGIKAETLVAVRNEAHRFTISYYRKLHRKALIAG